MNTVYSATPLIKKLSIKLGNRVQIINEPGKYMEWLGEDISNQRCRKNEQPDFVHLFAKDNDFF